MIATGKYELFYWSQQASFMTAEHTQQQVFKSTMSAFTDNIKKAFIFDLDISNSLTSLKMSLNPSKNWK